MTDNTDYIKQLIATAIKERPSLEARLNHMLEGLGIYSLDAAQDRDAPHLMAFANANSIPSEDNALRFCAHAIPHMDEAAEIRFISTGLQGGDAGHGACATVDFVIPNNHSFTLTVDDEQIEFGEGAVIMISANGDWEIDGLAEALVELGKKIEPLIQQRKASRGEAYNDQ